MFWEATIFFKGRASKRLLLGGKIFLEGGVIKIIGGIVTKFFGCRWQKFSGGLDSTKF